MNEEDFREWRRSRMSPQPFNQYWIPDSGEDKGDYFAVGLILLFVIVIGIITGFIIF